MSDPTYPTGRWPKTIDEVAALLPGVSRRKLLELAKKHGCASKFGNKYFLEKADFEALLQETKLPCRSKSYGAKALPKSMALTAEAELGRALELVAQKKRSANLSRSRRACTGPKSSEKLASQLSLQLVRSTSNKVAM